MDATGPVPASGLYVQRRCISNVDTAAFCQTLRDIDWSSVLLAAGREESGRNFNMCFLLDRVAPLRPARARPIAAPPVSADARQLMRRRRAALAGGDSDLYRRIDKECRAAIRLDSRAYFQREINKNSRVGLTPVLSRPSLVVKMFIPKL